MSNCKTLNHQEINFCSENNLAQPLVTRERDFELLVVLIFTRASDVTWSGVPQDDVRDSPGTKDNHDCSINLYSELRSIL